ncbi:flippase [Paraburkholderia tuberum]|uniref:Polysaccharide transporter, PST family/O-antigen flippase n=1 Tax=Paraburkholderia tuberum TaxID=157910 RepID=A0A1H1JJE8_9BURK|nr:flippase [Paraburkholderia tuberum]SDR50062.1 polysaccharide transporter, PST family/O-antigen flippase [Paraburkholderia tuberum]
MANPLRQNIVALTILQAANMLLPLATFPYLLRVLRPGHFGEYVFAQAIVGYLVLLTEYGFNWSSTAYVARVQNDRYAVSKIFWATQGAKALIAVVCLAILLLAAFFVARLRELLPVLLATYPLVIGTVLFPQWLFQGLERMMFTTISILSARLLLLPLTFFLVHSPADTWIASLISSTSMVAAGLVASILIAKNRMIIAMMPSKADIIEALREGWHTFISTAAISLYTTTNSVVLGFLAGNAAVGYFGVADKIRNVAQAPLGPLSNAIYPRVTALFSEDSAKAFALVRKMFYLLGSTMLLASVALWAGAELIVRVAMGPGYEPAVVVLKWMALMPLLICLSNVLGVQVMLPLGMKKKVSEILIASGFFNLALLFPLVSLYGAQGAAMSALATEFLVTTSMALYLIKCKVPAFQTRMHRDEI